MEKFFLVIMLVIGINNNCFAKDIIGERREKFVKNWRNITALLNVEAALRAKAEKEYPGKVVQVHMSTDPYSNWFNCDSSQNCKFAATMYVHVNEMYSCPENAYIRGMVRFDSSQDTNVTSENVKMDEISYFRTVCD